MNRQSWVHDTNHGSSLNDDDSSIASTPPTSQRSTTDNDSWVSSLSHGSEEEEAHSTSTLSISDLQQPSIEMKTNPDLESPSSPEEYMQDVDLANDCEFFPSYRCEFDSSQGFTTNQAVCHSKPDKRGRPVKPQTPKERWCGGCCCSNDNYNLDYDVNDDQVEFENDACHHRLLRYCRLLPPRPQERLIKRKIRFLLWWTILLDLIVALVALLQFGPAMTCCGAPIFSLPGVDIYQVMEIVLDVYLGVVILEILPVVREGCIPWNLMNPIFGFALGFMLFLNNAPMVALIVWILQIVSVALEFVTLRHYSILLKEAKQRMEQAEQQQQNHRKRRGYQKSKQERVLRELKSRRTKALYRWRKHLIGVTINVLLVIGTLLTIVYVAKRGGMCVQDGGTPSLFLFRNDMECTKASEQRRYETCNLDMGETECYFPFF